MTTIEAHPGPTPMRTLELGCGFTKTPGAFGVDIIAGSAADLIHDLDVFPYPLADNAFDRIICMDVLEHVTEVDGSVRVRQGARHEEATFHGGGRG